MLDKDIIIHRLAKIKYLFQLGTKQVKQHNSVAGFAVLPFHDCAEMFLLLVAEDEGKDTKQLSFMGYWSEFSGLTQKESMRRLKDIRVNLKHKGIMPTKEEISECAIIEHIFFQESCKNIFNLDFDDISLSDLVSDEEVRKHLKKAENFIEEGDLFQSLSESKIALICLIDNYKENPIFKFHRVYDVGKTIRKDFREIERLGIKNSTGLKWFNQVTDAITKLQDITCVLSLQLDYNRLVRFNLATPEIIKSASSTAYKTKYIVASKKEDFLNTHNINESLCKGCINFVIDSALHLQNIDINIHSLIRSNHFSI